ncbi:MAG: universal stress protein [Steroidobacteraceae bacterium]
MKGILVATDGSESAHRAVNYAAAQAKTLGVELVIANVIGGYGLPESVLEKLSRGQDVWLKELLKSQSASLLTEARSLALKAGLKLIRLESREGEVAATLIRLAGELEVDVIVVGKRGAGRAAGLLLGSVSQKLVSLAPFPVTVVP